MKLTIAIMLSALTISGAAIAQDPDGAAPASDHEALTIREACHVEARSLCPGKRGRDALMCLRENGGKVSAPCREAMQKRQLRHGPHPR